MDFNWDGDGKLSIPMAGVSYDINQDITYQKAGFTANLHIPSLSVSSSTIDPITGQISGESTSPLGSISYDICSLIPYCLNKSDSSSGSLGFINYSASYKAALLSLNAGISFGLHQIEKFSGALLGLIHFDHSVDLLAKTTDGFQNISSSDQLSFKPGESYYIDTHGSTIQASTDYFLDGVLNNKTDLTLTAYLNEQLLTGNYNLRVWYDSSIAGIGIKDDKSVGGGFGPIGQATQSAPIGSINLFDKNIPVQFATQGQNFTIASMCSSADLFVNNLLSTGIGSLQNAIQCANVTPFSSIILAGGLGTLVYDPNLPNINNDVTVFAGGNTLIGFNNVNIVAEPTSIALLTVGLFGFGVYRSKIANARTI